MPSAKYMKQYRTEAQAISDLIKQYEADDALGQRHKSEVLSYRDLILLFYGYEKDSYKVKKQKESEEEPEAEECEAEEPEEEEDSRKKKRVHRKKNIVQPVAHEFFGLEISFEQWLTLRDRARKDLFWLAKDVCKKGLVEFTHRIICEQFVQKNFDGAFPEGYTVDDVHAAINRQVRMTGTGVDTKELILLDPRGFYKSTIDGIDCVQWLLNVPDVRVLLLTGEYKLGIAFLKEIKAYFHMPEKSEPKMLHLLFPEYIITGVDGDSKEPLQCPARLISQKEPSVWVNSIDSNLSGWHCDVRKMDDVVTDENSNNVDTRRALKHKADGTGNLLDEWGFSDIIGTRYWVDDYYGTKMKPEEGDPDAEVAPFKYHCRACWTVKPEYVDVPLRKLTEEMVVLTFPEKAPFKSLRRKLLTNERQFRNQQLNQPTASDEDSLFKISFDEDMLRKHTIQPAAAPREGDIIVCWDWAATANKQSDFSAGAAGRLYKKVVRNELLGIDEIQWGICVLDVIYDKWKSSDLAFQIVAFDKKWHPKQTLIESAAGADLLKLEIARNAQKYGVSMNIYWKPVDSTPDAKRNRIKGIETLITRNCFWFVASLWNDMAYKQFCDYTGERKNRGRKDDIPDAMSFLTFYLPTTQNSEEKKKIEDAQQKVVNQQLLYSRIFGNSTQYKPQQVETARVPQSIDPRQKLFGGNGMHI